MTPEGRSKAAVKVLLERHKKYLWWYMPVQTGHGQQGIPDFIICCCGWFFGVECKAVGGAISPLQRMQLSRIAEAHGVAMVVWGTDTMELDVMLQNAIREYEAATHKPD